MVAIRGALLLAFALATGVALAVDFPIREWFPKGLESVEVGIPHKDVATLQASCVKCHGGAHQEWAVSAHAKAWTDPLFQEGFRIEAKDRCVHCHAPLEAQFLEYKSGSGALLSTGVNCVSCHVRDGVVQTAHKTGEAPHEVVEAKNFGSPVFCAGCHDFHLGVERDSGSAIAQSTYREWNKYIKSGGTKSCVDCHSSPMKHSFPGPDKLNMKMVTLHWKRSARRIEFVITNDQAGHAVPTGDLFREVLLEVSTDKGKSFKQVLRLGKTYARPGLKSDQLRPTKLISDTRLMAKESVSATISVKDRASKVSYRLVYYRSPKFLRKNSVVPRSEWFKVLESGVVN